MTQNILGAQALAVTLAMLSGFVGSDLAQDRAECMDQLVGLATCLPCANNDGKVPPQDCCSGLRIVLHKSLKCLCILVRVRNDPDLGIKVNTTLALSLPSSCSAPVNTSKCIDSYILQLAPTSDDAKVFSDFEKSLETKNTTQAPSTNASSGGSPATSSRFSSDGTVRRPFSASQCLTGALIWVYARGLFQKSIKKA